MSGSKPFRNDKAASDWIRTTLRRMAKPQVRHNDGHGLYLRLSLGGTATWTLKRAVNGKPQEKTLGHFPAVGVNAARAKAAEWRAAIDDGKDPAKDEAEARAAELAARQAREEAERQLKLRTFNALAERFMREHVQRKLRASMHTAYGSTLGLLPATIPSRSKLGKPRQRRCYVAAWRSRPIKEISSDDVDKVLNAIYTEAETKFRKRHPDYPTAKQVPAGVGVGGNRIRVYLHRFFEWCIKERCIVVNPVMQTSPKAAERKLDRVLTDAELVEVWNAIDERGGKFKTVLKIMAYTGQRENEVAGMRWSELNLDGPEPLWSMPPSRTKKERAHNVPLAPQVVAMLRAVPKLEDSDLVFTTTGKTPLSGWSKLKARIDTEIARARRAAGIEADMPAWRFHDLRRTARTAFARAGVAPEVARAIVNHKAKGMDAIYDRFEYLPQRRAALTEWANEMDGIIAGTSRNNVVQLRAAGAS